MIGYINPTAFEIFGIAIQWYAIIIVSGIMLATWLATREAERVNLDPEYLVDMLLWALPLSILGARIYYVAFEWDYYAQNPGQILAIRNGGLAIYGGLIAGAVVVYLFTRKRKIDTWLLLDVIAPTVLLGQAIGRWGNFMNHEAHGGAVSRQFLESLYLPSFIIKNMNIDGVYYQPTFLYESLWSLLGFAIIMSLRHRPHLFKKGEITLSYVIWYSFGRFFIEGMRTDSLYLVGELRISQALSMMLFMAGIAVFVYRRRLKNLVYYSSYLSIE